MDTFTFFSVASTILFQIVFVIMLVSAALKAPWVSFIRKNAQLLTFLLFISSIGGSLIFEHTYLYEPCMLCWYQRVFMISSAVILSRGIWLKKNLLGEALTLSTFGLLFALFHNYIDIFPSGGVEVCTGNVSCLTRYIYAFGYITIPMMSLSVFALGMLIMKIGRNPQA